MNSLKRQSGLTLTELVVTLAVATILLGLAIPAAKRLTDSLQNGAGTRALISAALSNARAMAVRTGKDAAVRFEQGSDGRMYMVYLVYAYDISAGLADRFVAANGRKPTVLPENIDIQPNKATIVFSPAGKLVIRNVRAQARSATDSLYNTQVKVQAGSAIFVQDGGNVSSTNGFLVRDIHDPVNNLAIMVSPYTGELIGE